MVRIHPLRRTHRGHTWCQEATELRVKSVDRMRFFGIKRCVEDPKTDRWRENARFELEVGIEIDLTIVKRHRSRNSFVCRLISTCRYPKQLSYPKARCHIQLQRVSRARDRVLSRDMYRSASSDRVMECDMCDIEAVCGRIWKHLLRAQNSSFCLDY